MFSYSNLCKEVNLKIKVSFSALSFVYTSYYPKYRAEAESMKDAECRAEKKSRDKSCHKSQGNVKITMTDLQRYLNRKLNLIQK